MSESGSTLSKKLNCRGTMPERSKLRLAQTRLPASVKLWFLESQIYRQVSSAFFFSFLLNDFGDDFVTLVLWWRTKSSA